MFTNFINSIRDWFTPAHMRDQREFERLQVEIAGLFAGTEDLRHDLHRTEQARTAAEHEAASFTEAQKEMLGDRWFVHDRLNPKMLHVVKFTAVALEGVLSVAAMDLFIREVAGFAGLELLPWVKIAFNGTLAYGLLRGAMVLREIGMARKKQGIDGWASRLAFVLPISIIPLLSLFIVLGTAGDTSIQSALAVLTLLFNLLVAYWADEFTKAKKAKAARERADLLDATVSRAREGAAAVQAHVSQVRQRITVLATQLLAVFLRLKDHGAEPKMSLSLAAIHALHQHVHFRNVYPLPDKPTLTIAQGELGQYGELWRIAQPPVVARQDRTAEGVTSPTEQPEIPASTMPTDNRAAEEPQSGNDERTTTSTGLDNDSVHSGDKYL